MDGQRRETDTVAVDEVARQRQKRAARLDHLVSGTTAVATGEPAHDGTVHIISAGEHRLRTVAHLEALLLKD